MPLIKVLALINPKYFNTNHHNEYAYLISLVNIRILLYKSNIYNRIYSLRIYPRVSDKVKRATLDGTKLFESCFSKGSKYSKSPVNTNSKNRPKALCSFITITFTPAAPAYHPHHYKHLPCTVN